jgi:YaaC-like Protein
MDALVMLSRMESCYSTNPDYSFEADVNRSIRYFTSQEFIRQRYYLLHGRSPNAAKARSIALHVDQGINFIDSATRAPVSIRPLLQYYGVAALARAVSVFRDVNRAENTLTPGHGLHVLDWNVLGCSHAGRGFSDLNVQVTAGLFSDLSAATGGLAHFYANNSGPNWLVKLGAIEAGAEFNFTDLLGLLPDLWEEHAAWTGAAHKRFALQGATASPAGNSERVTWKIGTREAADEVRTLFPDESTDVTQLKVHEFQVLTSVDTRFQPVQLHHGAFDIGDTLLVPPIGTQGTLSTIEIYCATSYVMSMLCRYRLSDWLAVWRGEKGDIARPIFERAMDLVDEQFPQLCSDLMKTDGTVTS